MINRWISSALFRGCGRIVQALASGHKQSALSGKVGQASELEARQVPEGWRGRVENRQEPGLDWS